MFDFVTSIWPGASRAPASMPSREPTVPNIDDRWKVAGKCPARKRKASNKRPAIAKQPSPPIDGADAVVLALIATCRECGPWRMLSVSELAEAMHCSVGEASKRVKQAAEVDSFVWTHRRGRQKMVGLHRVSSEKWQQIVSSTPAAAVGLYRMFTADLHRLLLDRGASSSARRTEVTSGYEELMTRRVIGTGHHHPHE